MKIREILRLREQGFSYADIGISAGIPKSTVGDTLAQCRACGLGYEQARSMTDEAIQELLYPNYGTHISLKPEPDYALIYKQLKETKNINLQYIWETQYHAQYPDGLKYSQFCNKYAEWKKRNADENVTLHMEREPGREIFVDWMGETPACVLDAEKKTLVEAHFFLAVLGKSSYPFVEAFPDEGQISWITAHVDALEYYGGVPKVIIPDNCKTAVKSPNYYDPTLNPGYRSFAEHYDLAIMPCRVRAPRDKSIVEESVGWLQVWLLGSIRGRVFHSFDELNLHVRNEMQLLSRRNYKKRPGNRYTEYLEIDRPHLRDLPAQRFEIADVKANITVRENYHVEYKGFYYSVPYRLFQQKVSIRATGKTIEIFDANDMRVATHPRRYSGRRYVTDLSHMPENHRVVHLQNMYDGDHYRSWASNIGSNTRQVIDHLLDDAFVCEEQGYRSCMGVLQFSKTYGNVRLENSCARALSLGDPSYRTVRNILKNGMDLQPEEADLPPVPEHENVRGAGYYV